MPDHKLGPPVIPLSPKIETGGQVFVVLSCPVATVQDSKRKGGKS